MEALPLLAHLYLKTGMMPRGLTDRMQGGIPILKHAIYYLGAVAGTRENCREVMSTGAPVLVFPGKISNTNINIIHINTNTNTIHIYILTYIKLQADLMKL